MKKIAVLGSTGSIGTQTLEVVRAQKDIEVTALAAGSNITRLEEQIREFHPEIVCVWEEERAKELALAVKDMPVKVVYGMEGLIEAAVDTEAEIVVTAIVGMIGIRPTIAAMEAGKDIALANKETLVTAGHIIMPLAKEKGARRCLPLKVSGPFHTPLMAPAGDALAERFRTVEFREPQGPVIFNCLGAERPDGAAIPELLVRQVQSSVYMEDSLRRMATMGLDALVEIGPGKALSGFVKKTVPELPVYPQETAAELEQLTETIKGASL